MKFVHKLTSLGRAKNYFFVTAGDLGLNLFKDKSKSLKRLSGLFSVAALGLSSSIVLGQSVDSSWSSTTYTGGSSGSNTGTFLTSGTLGSIANITVGGDNKFNAGGLFLSNWNNILPASYLPATPSGPQAVALAYTPTGAPIALTFSSAVTDPILMFNYVDKGTYTFASNIQLINFSGTATGSVSGNVLTISNVGSGDANNGVAVQVLGTYTSLNFSIRTTTGQATDSAGFGIAALGLPNIISSNNNQGSFNKTSSLGSNVFYLRFSGGTLAVDQANQTYGQNFTITSANGFIDQKGQTANFGGVFANDGSPAGRLTIVNSVGTNGAVTLAGVNTYSGGTEIQAGATLSIGDSRSIGSGGLDLVGTSNVAATLATTSNMTISAPITVSGDPIFSVAPSTTLTVSSPITNGSSAGDVVASGGGTLKLTAANTYSGLTAVDSGSTLALSGAGAIAASSGVVDNGTFDISAATAGASIKSLSGSGTVVLGAKTLSITAGANTFDGVIGGTGGVNITSGTETLTGTNTYTGATSIGAGSTLAISGAGAIAASSGVAVAGAFDLSGTNTGASVKEITGAGNVSLGSKQLTVTNANGNLSGVVGGTGSLNIAGGNQTLSGNNTFSGGVQVQSGASLTIPAAGALGSGTLNLVGSSSVPATLNVTGTTTIVNHVTVAGDPVFNIASGTTTTISSPISNAVVGGSAVPGDVVVTGGGSLALTAANTYTGSTTVDNGSTLLLSGAGSIANSAALNNSGTTNVTGKSGNVVLGGSFTQAPTGSLLMNISPANNQKILVTGVASLAGSLYLNASPGTYAAGRYTLLTANGVTGKFGAFATNLISPLSYTLGYDANEVYLYLLASGPSTIDTQYSLVNTAAALQNIFTLQNSVLANSFTYDCNVFGANDVCVSAGGRNTAVSAANGLNNTSALLIAAYRPHPNYRIGVYADQNLSVNNAGSTVNLGNNTPLIGLFGAWNERLDGTGTEVKVSAAYGQKNATVTRQVVGTSEAGSGSSQLNSQGAQVTAKYGFGVVEDIVVSPYIGVRYTQNNMGGYTEATSTSVTAPLTYSALNTNATTGLAGVGASYRFIPQAMLFASAGVESDTNTANGTYSATGVAGLAPVNFNANPVKTRPTASVGAYYDLEKNHRIGVTGIYRQEAYQAVQTTTVMATYTVGL